MRSLIFIVIVAVLLVVAAVATGFVNIRQLRGGQPPQITADRNGVSAKGGQSPAFDVETGSVKVGTKETTVKTPTLEIQKPRENQSNEAANNGT